MRALLAAPLLAAALTVGAATPALAQPTQRGLVNVNVGDVTVLENVGVGVAANAAAQICGVAVNANVLAEQVVRGGQADTVCTVERQGAQAPVTITP